MAGDLTPSGYNELVRDLKQRIRTAQVRAALAVNRELVLLYWSIGRDILARQQQHGWGAKVVEQLSADLRREFPDMKGFSPRNLKYMRAFAEAWPNAAIVQQVAAQLPWFHNCVLLDKLHDPSLRLWYANAAKEYGWSRNVLVLQIEGALHRRQGAAITNFERTLPPLQSDLARQLLKDPYNFDFLTLGQEAEERDLERGLLDNIRQFLLELGTGFAFVGNQYRLQVGGEDFYLDLLFYHLRLRCFVVIDLKMGRFKPADAGQMNSYLSVVDDVLRHPDDAPSIGIVLCKTKDRVIAEYALRDVGKPMGVAQFRVTELLPDTLKDSLPSIEQLEAELARSDTFDGSGSQ